MDIRMEGMDGLEALRDDPETVSWGQDSAAHHFSG